MSASHAHQFHGRPFARTGSCLDISACMIQDIRWLQASFPQSSQ